MLTRRTLLTGAAALLAAPTVLRAAYAPDSAAWRRFEVTTRVTLPRNGAPAQAWVPLPAHTDPLWSLPGESTATAQGATLTRVDRPEDGFALIHATWDAADTPAELTVTSTVTTRDRFPGQGRSTLTTEERTRFTAPTELLPTDGIVRETAMAAIEGAMTDLDRARILYNWVVEQTERNPETRGCGLGDIASMLHIGDLTGKCADLNALFVGLARAAGLPARDLYGLRVAPSAFGYSSLGAGSTNVTGAQHCRAEVFVEGEGWIPADPADVRKVVLQEDGGLTLDDPRVQDVRSALFGAAEGNWIPFGTAHDVVLPGSDGPVLPFLMYPQAEVGGERRDELDPESFTYEITARETAV
ncbi:transglutaminase-like domain-containing protein [Ponticoccus alexandrii]|uniref:Transglutaminase n=1 Tax=Ponticoccus alexandrii TaxID=1943633 RepID=A0ABX7F993_9RHOB|nr:transglutaminase-like domain-containing protein [Ponticoccus alexandrii]ETA51556.1 transglutaminase [Rhodobacteraceae bacterium PD-2]QRF66701.1 transglutaminase [Ponticoccus alexandrii]